MIYNTVYEVISITRFDGKQLDHYQNDDKHYNVGSHVVWGYYVPRDSDGNFHMRFYEDDSTEPVTVTIHFIKKCKNTVEAWKYIEKLHQPSLDPKEPNYDDGFLNDMKAEAEAESAYERDAESRYYRQHHED